MEVCVKKNEHRLSSAMGKYSGLLVAGILILSGCGNVPAPQDAGTSLTTETQDTAVRDEAGNNASPENSTDSQKIVSGEDSTAVAEDADMPDYDFTLSYEGIATAAVNANAVVHDPSVYQADGHFYIFGSHMTAARTDDLRVWKMFGNGYSKGNAVYGDLFQDTEHVFRYTGLDSSIIPTDGAGGCRLWAPDVIYNKAMGKYCLYYCTSSTFNASTLEFATADSIEGPYEWAADLICSGLTKDTIPETDVTDHMTEEEAVKAYTTNAGSEYDFRQYPNALDPTVFYDRDGGLWMVYGSWSGGIFLIELDEETGLPIHPEADPDNEVDVYFGKRLLGGWHKSIEGPYILYDPSSDYYYLFVSYGSLQADGGYQIRVFRSREVAGEYVDMNGARPLLKTGNHATFGLKLSGNYMLPSLKRGYKATGHNSAIIDETADKRYIVYHTRFENNGENHQPRVKQYFLNKEGWPCVLPYCTDGETISAEGYSKDDLTGRYYVVDQGSFINATIAQPVIYYLEEDGSIIGRSSKEPSESEVSGNWSIEAGTPYMTITLGDREYSGIFCAQNDEAGTNVMTFSAVGGNESLWGVKYHTQ